jgi:hypothetical protein
MSTGDLLRFVLFVLGGFFLAANLRVLVHLARYRRLRPTAELVWPGRAPPMYPLWLAMGALLAFLVVFKVGITRRPALDAFGESMMSLYYVFALPSSLRIGRGFYADGIWTESGFVPYGRVGGLSWRHGGEPTLVILDRTRPIARRLLVPEGHLGAVRRLLRDKIAAHAIMFVEKSLDLGAHDERDDV